MRPIRASARDLAGRLSANGPFRGLLVAAVAVGVVTGLGVAAFHFLVSDVVFDHLVDLPLAVAAVCPLVGLGITSLVLRSPIGPSDGATTDAYVRAYHSPGGELALRDLPGRMLAAAATLGGGAALGFEGPSILLGATVGSAVQRRAGRRLGPGDARVLMVAGAAAGVAAIFKAPLTGVVFALEVPYRQDLARRALLPALLAASASYVTFAALAGTEPILLTRGSAPFDVADLGGALVLGLACGVLARVGAAAIARAKRIVLAPWLRVGVAGAVLAGLAVLSSALFDETLSLGSGYRAISWATASERSVWLLAALFAIRAGATWLAVAGGGVGGLFVPLVVQGAVTGAMVESLVQVPNATLFPTIGIAAFLGAGYRTPLAGVAFVAEATGQAGFVVPALVAAVVAQLAMGGWSFSSYQRHERLGHLEQRLTMRVADVLTPDPASVAADATVASFMEQAVGGTGRRWLPVVEGGRFAGTIALADAIAVPQHRWDTTLVVDVMRRAGSVAPDAPVATAAAVMRREGDDRVAVVEDGAVVGVLTARDLTKLDQLLDVVDADDRPRDAS